MTSQTVCIPLNSTGVIAGRLGQANTVVLCRVDGAEINDWTHLPVDWETTYGVDVPGVHHPRVIRFLQEHEVTTVIADQVCDVMQGTLPKLGVSVQAGFTGDPRIAVETALVA